MNERNVHSSLPCSLSSSLFNGTSGPREGMGVNRIGSWGVRLSHFPMLSLASLTNKRSWRGEVERRSRKGEGGKGRETRKKG